MKQTNKKQSLTPHKAHESDAEKLHWDVKWSLGCIKTTMKAANTHRHRKCDKRDTECVRADTHTDTLYMYMTGRTDQKVALPDMHNMCANTRARPFL